MQMRGGRDQEGYDKGWETWAGDKKSPALYGFQELYPV